MLPSRSTDRQIERQTDIQSDKQTSRQANSQWLIAIWLAGSIRMWDNVANMKWEPSKFISNMNTKYRISVQWWSDKTCSHQSWYKDSPKRRFLSPAQLGRWSHLWSAALIPCCVPQFAARGADCCELQLVSIQCWVIAPHALFAARLKFRLCCDLSSCFSWKYYKWQRWSGRCKAWPHQDFQNAFICYQNKKGGVNKSVVICKQQFIQRASQYRLSNEHGHLRFYIEQNRYFENILNFCSASDDSFFFIIQCCFRTLVCR